MPKQNDSLRIIYFSSLIISIVSIKTTFGADSYMQKRKRLSSTVLSIPSKNALLRMPVVTLNPRLLVRQTTSSRTNLLH